MYGERDINIRIYRSQGMSKGGYIGYIEVSQGLRYRCRGYRISRDVVLSMHTRYLLSIVYVNTIEYTRLYYRVYSFILMRMIL